ncbi:MAG TPA: MBL fold metallo-hydrolase [Thermoanaerobaculia bacterium]|nr:MBL fold metallo-hydrolase [Thermoanaerobaculia bacterium]
MTKYPSVQIGNFQLRILNGGSFSLDGGAMFGVVPRTMWSREEPPDPLNRIRLHCNCLLISRENDHVLVETGMGFSWTEKQRHRFAIDSGSLEQSLEDLNLQVSSITHVVNTHLHFDHAGGNFINLNGESVPRYPRASYYVQEREWTHGLNPTWKDRASYRSEDFEKLELRGQLVRLEGASEIIPGIRVLSVGGHSPGMQLVEVRDGSERAVFLADLIPTRHHVRLPWLMAYDSYPITTLQVKENLLPELAEDGSLVVLYHDNRFPMGHIRREGNDSFQFIYLPIFNPEN